MTQPSPIHSVSLPTRIAPVWRDALVALAFLLATTVWLFRSTAEGMIQLWRSSDTYAHGFVVPLIVLWLIWRQRGLLALKVPRASWMAVGIALVVVSAWSAGDLVAVNAVTQLAFVSLLIVWVIAVLGWEVARALAFPLSFLYFAVPIGDFLLPRMMEWTADFTVMAVRASGVPVYREGLQFVIPSGTWSVVEACSGIRYLIASLTVGCLFAYLSFNRWHKRLIFVGVSVLVPLIANWVRAYLIVMMGHLSGNELATGVDHLIYGWVFFGVVIFVMLLLGARWADAPQSITDQHAGSRATQRSESDPREELRQRSLLHSFPWSMVLAGMLVAWLPHGLNVLWAKGVKQTPVAWASIVAVPPWRMIGERPVEWSPAFEHAASTTGAGFAKDADHWVGVHVSYYRQQDYVRKLVTSSNVLVASGNPGWVLVGQDQESAGLDGQELTVGTAVIREARSGNLFEGRRLVAWRFYWVDGVLTGSDIEAKLRGAWGRAAGRGDDGAIVVLYTSMDLRDGESRAMAASAERLSDFLRTHRAALQQFLTSTREGG